MLASQRRTNSEIFCAKTLYFSKGNQRLEKCEMDDKNKINLRENNREIFKRERTIEQIQLIRGRLKIWKKWNHKKCNLIK